MQATGTEVDQSPPWSPATKAIVAITLLILFAAGLLAFRIVIVPLVVGTIIAYIFRPVVRAIRRATRLSRPVVAALVYLVLLALVILAVVLLTPVVVNQLGSLQQEVVGFMRYLNETSPGATITVMDFEIGMEMVVNEVNTSLLELVRSLAAGSLTLIRNVAEVILLTVFTFLISFYITRDAEKFIQLIEDLVPPSHRRDAQRLLKEIDKVWSAFFRGQIILSVIVSILLTGLAAALGLPRPALIGLLGGLLEFLPSVGHFIWGVTAVVVALIDGSTHLPVSNVTFSVIVFAAYVIFTQLDLNVLIPNIIGSHVGLHPMAVIIGIIVGAMAGGVLGVLLAAPTIASLRVIGRYVYAKLLGMNPFPMVGPPSAPWHERGEIAERQAEAHTRTEMHRSAILKRLKR